MAPMVPATWVPWPLSSLPVPVTQVPVEQFARLTTLRSGWAMIPLSMTATSTSMRTSSTPSMSRLGLVFAKIRRTPVGTVWALRCSIRSGSTNATFGSVFSCAASAVVMSAE